MAEAARRDSSTLMGISFISALFLPGTAIAVRFLHILECPKLRTNCIALDGIWNGGVLRGRPPDRRLFHIPEMGNLLEMDSTSHSRGPYFVAVLVHMVGQEPSSTQRPPPTPTATSTRGLYTIQLVPENSSSASSAALLFRDNKKL
jgi:hypothetical protein